MKYTLGELIDKLTIENIRIWMLHEQKDTLDKIKVCNKRRNKLIAAINEWAKEEGGESDKSY